MFNEVIRLVRAGLAGVLLAGWWELYRGDAVLVVPGVSPEWTVPAAAGLTFGVVITCFTRGVWWARAGNLVAGTTVGAVVVGWVRGGDPLGETLVATRFFRFVRPLTPDQKEQLWWNTFNRHFSTPLDWPVPPRGYLTQVDAATVARDADLLGRWWADQWLRPVVVPQGWTEWFVQEALLPGLAYVFAVFVVWWHSYGGGGGGGGGGPGGGGPGGPGGPGAAVDPEVAVAAAQLALAAAATAAAAATEYSPFEPLSSDDEDGDWTNLFDYLTAREEAATAAAAAAVEVEPTPPPPPEPTPPPSPPPEPTTHYFLPGEDGYQPQSNPMDPNISRMDAMHWLIKITVTLLEPNLSDRSREGLTFIRDHLSRKLRDDPPV